MESVTIIAKTHLDIGFTDLAGTVTERYLHDYVRQAVETADGCRAANKPYRYVWTVGAWLVRQCLDRLTGAERATFDAALRRGDIVWHAMPFTTQSETAGERGEMHRGSSARYGRPVSIHGAVCAVSGYWHI